NICQIAATGVLTSVEARLHQVQGFYQRFLHREGEPGGVSAHAGALLHGVPQAVVAAAFLGSAEYFAALMRPSPPAMPQPAPPPSPVPEVALPPTVAVALGRRAALPADTQDVSWQAVADVTGLETLIQVRQPGNVYPVGGTLDVRPGNLPATGDVVYLKADG